MYRTNTVRYDEYYEQINRYNTLPVQRKPVKKIIRKNKIRNIFSSITALVLLSILGYFMVPYSVKTTFSTYKNPNTTINNVNNQIVSPNFNNKSGIDYSQLVSPTLSYLDNYSFFNQRMSYPAQTKKAQMVKIHYGDRMVGLENSLRNLMKQYPTVKPSILVMSVDNHNFASIDSDKVYPAASIIKLPVLIQLYKSIENEMFSTKDNMYLTEFYRSEGSGSMQYSKAGNKYSIYDLAKVMIQDSDNSATNMLIAKIGSMNDINAAIKDWGLSHTHLQTWLPDITGNNYTTAEDITRMLYNIGNDDNEFFNINSQSDIIKIMGNVKNTSLIKAGLPDGVDFIHKTGDIGTMLGDAGIVYLPSGQRYIVVILALRKHNDVNGRLFIQDASKIIYNYMSARH